MIKTEELIELLKTIDTTKSGHFINEKVDFDLTYFLNNVSTETQFEIVKTHEGNYSIVKESPFMTTDFSKQSIFFDFHADGLYYRNNVPTLVILFCSNKGKQKSDTAFIDTDLLAPLIAEHKQLMEKLSIVYVGRNGEDNENKLLQKHKWTGERFLTLGSRAYIRPSKDLEVKDYPILRDIADLTTEIYSQISKAEIITHRWTDNDFILFDNQRFLHARFGSEQDVERELIRVWLDKK
jgi:alpha-ketoglutarate-dependent taurine dioxygenase